MLMWVKNMNELFENLNNLINKYDNFIIMGHSNPDLDVLGSALALHQIITEKNKNAYIFLDNDNKEKYNDSITKSLEKVNAHFTCEKNYLNLLNNSLLIIIDVYQQDRLEYPNILESKIDTIILDHHIMSQKYIRNTILLYNDTTLSSVAELITYFAKYCNTNLDFITSTIMLAGMEIDTNNYNVKTTSNTYIAASYLMEMGADTILKQELLKESKDDYIKRADYIKNSFMVNGHIAMCILHNICEKEDLAEIADELLKFVNVEASFAIGELYNGNIGISARSIGNYDVEKIMKQFNGGGHKTNAAAEVSNKNIREIKNKIIKIVR